MNIDEGKKSRAALKTYFVKNAVPTESQFAQFIDSGLNQRDDGLVKAAGDPLSIEAVGDAASFKKALNFYGSFADAEPAFTIALRPRVAIGDPGSGRPGFSIGDAAGNSRLCIDATNGNVGIGTAAPQAKLQVSGGGAALNYVIIGTTPPADPNHAPASAYPWPYESVGTYHKSHNLRLISNTIQFHTGYATDAKGALDASGNLTVNGVVNSAKLTLGPWPASPGNYVFFGTNTLDQAAAGNYALLQGSNAETGRTFLNSPVDIRFRIGNADKMVLANNGDLAVNGLVNVGKLTIGPWPANPGNYVFFGTNALDQAVAGNYALRQDAAGSDAGRTYLNSPVDIRFRIGNVDKMVLAADGDLSVTGAIRAGNSDLYFTKTDHNHYGGGNAAGNAAIENGANYGALMILGRTVSTSPLKRVVKLWDELTVHGPLIVTAAHTIKIGVPSPKTPPRYGNDGIRGEPNLWLDAAGTVFIKPGFQTPSGFDIAERFAAIEPLAAGTVVVFDEDANAIRRCDRAADGRVVGIVSGEAAFILGSDEAEVPIALIGRVPCLADADSLPIRCGDLLTTSATPGHAQRVDDAERCRGAIIGKALTSLAAGKGSVLVLVNGY